MAFRLIFEQIPAYPAKITYLILISDVDEYFGAIR